MLSFCILIPTINRKDLLVEALDFYTTHMPSTQILIWDNGNQDIPTYPNTEVFVQDHNFGVAASWNALMVKAQEKGFSNYLILNDDIILRCPENRIEQLLNTNKAENAFYRCQATYNWSVFLLRQSIVDVVGNFDENFKRCYFEDNDYQYRMKLAGIPVIYEPSLNPEVYRNSQTILKDPLLSNFIDNRNYFISKWGGDPEKETFKTPFNK